MRFSYEFSGVFGIKFGSLLIFEFIMGFTTF